MLYVYNIDTYTHFHYMVATFVLAPCHIVVILLLHFWDILCTCFVHFGTFLHQRSGAWGRGANTWAPPPGPMMPMGPGLAMQAPQLLH